jgi:hypothetical protein
MAGRSAMQIDVFIDVIDVGVDMQHITITLLRRLIVEEL